MSDNPTKGRMMLRDAEPNQSGLASPVERQRCVASMSAACTGLAAALLKASGTATTPGLGVGADLPAPPTNVRS